MTEAVNIRLKIADVLLNILMNVPVHCTEQFEPFLCSNSTAAWDVYVEQVLELPQISGKTAYEASEYCVYASPDGLTRRVYLDRLNNGKPYAVETFSINERFARVCFLESAKEYFSETGNLFFHIGWEKIMCAEQRFILHAACVDTLYGGILFSGESGVGKSTQADLWCKYGSGELINGDRAIIGNKAGCWRAYGSPYAGSSKCYRNISCEIGAIVMLSQSSECRIKRLGEAEAFRRIYANTTIHSWDPAFVNRVCDMISTLIKAVPVFELECTPDERAVHILQSALGEMQYE